MVATVGVAIRPVATREAWLLGMGGSSLSAGLVELVLRQTAKPIRWNVIRDYRLPWRPSAGDLVLGLSYSGNTEETLSAVAHAADSDAVVVAVSKGGRLEELARERRIPWVGIPDKSPGFQPRFALPFMTGTVLSILHQVGLLDSLESLHDVASWLDGLDLSDDGSRLAEFLSGRIPVIYTPPEYEAGVARTWRIKFNENTKIPALSGCLPEANHNEIMGFPAGSQHPFSFVFLTDENADPRIQKRFPLTAELLTRNGYPVQTHSMVGDTPLRKALHSLMLADWTSYHLAILRGVDPIAVPDIQQFKERLNQ